MILYDNHPLLLKMNIHQRGGEEEEISVNCQYFKWVAPLTESKKY